MTDTKMAETKMKAPKRIGICLLLLTLVITAAACGSKSNEKTEQAANATIQNDGQAEATSDQTVPSTEEEPAKPDADPVQKPKDPLAALAKGEIPEEKQKLGVEAQLLVQEKGDPDSEDWIAGHYLQYGDCLYFTDGYTSEERGNLVAIYYLGKEKVYGIPVGSTKQEIEAAFGKPDATGTVGMADEMFPGTAYASYVRGDYTLTVLYDKAGTKSICFTIR